MDAVVMLRVAMSRAGRASPPFLAVYKARAFVPARCYLSQEP